MAGNKEAAGERENRDGSIRGLALSFILAAIIAASAIAYAYATTDRNQSTTTVAAIEDPQRVIEKPVYIERIKYVNQTVEIEKPVYVNRTVEVEKPVYIDRTVEVEKKIPVYINRTIEVPVYVEKVVEKQVFVDRVPSNNTSQHNTVDNTTGFDGKIAGPEDREAVGKQHSLHGKHDHKASTDEKKEHKDKRSD